MQSEKVVETKTCKHCSSSFHITDKDMEFYEKVSPVFSCRDTICRDTINRVSTRKYIIPPPTLCPECRQQRRLSFRNERKLYKRKCDATGENIISIYSPDKTYKVYHQGFWWSDKWSPMDYGREFDFNRSFFEQFEKLHLSVPRISLFYYFSENCDYTNHAYHNKDCYLLFNAAYCENVYFSSNLMYRCSDCVDCMTAEKGKLLYECIMTKDCFNSNHLIQCNNCSDSSFLYDCNNCDNCFMCWNLRNRDYCIMNEKLTKQDYFKRLESINISSSKEYKKYKNHFFKNIKTKAIHKNFQIENSENSTGDYIFNSKNTYNTFYADNCEDIKYCYDALENKDSMDTYESSINVVLQYECYGCNESSNCHFCIITQSCDYMIYCDFCFNCQNCFSCVGLKNKSYCILNKQYTKEEYETLVPKIIEHMISTGDWGEFFPSSMSPFGYNETVAQEYYPLDRRDTINRVSTDGKQIFNWSTYEAPFPKVDKIIPANKLPDDIKDIPDDILNRAIMPDDECDENDVGTGFKPVPTETQIKKPFRIIPQELEFYRKHGLPIPRKHPDQRHLDRTALRNPRKLFDRKCDKCGKDMKTTYAPDRDEIVYCQKCYEKSIY